MFLLMLSTCVFIWGLGYKLSLYQVHGSKIHRIPEAKLLSRNEDSGARDSAQLSLANHASFEQGWIGFAVLVLFSMGIGGGSQSVFQGTNRIITEPLCPRSAAVLSAFFLRPPPVLLAL
jgi:hypothetical protein